MAEVLNQPVVIDNGTGIIKAGFAGADKPKGLPHWMKVGKTDIRDDYYCLGSPAQGRRICLVLRESLHYYVPRLGMPHDGEFVGFTIHDQLCLQVVFASHVGRPKHKRAMIGGALDGDVFLGKKVEEHRGVFRLTYPMEHGVVKNWADMEKVWAHVYGRDNLNVAPEDHAVLLTEAPLNPYKNRRQCAETFFENFGVPAMFCAPQAILSLYASGRTTGVVLDSGDGVTHCVPVYEGFAVRHAITRIDVAGRDVTERLQLLLRRAGHNLHTSAEMEVVRQMKEDLCYVAFNPATEEKVTQPDTVYKLPDGQTIRVGPERYRAPECLFHPEQMGSECMGVHDCLVKGIMRTDMDMRRTLFGQVVLSGGSTLFPGFGDRLLNEVRKQAPKNLKIRITAPPERKFSTWVGGSILASLATFKEACKAVGLSVTAFTGLGFGLVFERTVCQDMWVTRAEFREHGPSIMDSKSL